MLLKISAAPKGKGFNGRVFPKGKALSGKAKRGKDEQQPAQLLTIKLTICILSSFKQR